MKKFIIVTIALIYSSLAFSVPQQIQEETDKLIMAMQSNDIVQQKRAAQKLEWYGISDIQLFDLIEKNLLEKYPRYGNERYLNNAYVDYFSWLVKALAFSGQEKYMPTLQTVLEKTTSDKLSRYTSIAIEQLPKYKQWNKIIVNEAVWNPSVSSDTNRFTQMLKSDDYELLRLVSKRIYFQNVHDSELLDKLEMNITEHYLDNNNTRIFQDSFAWMCKALANSRIEKYKETLVLVATSAKNLGLRSRANDYLVQYFKDSSYIPER